MSACGHRESRRLAGFRRRLSCGGWLFPNSCRSFSRFGRGLDRGWQFQLGLFPSAMVAMVQRLDARGFFFHPQLSVPIFMTLVFQVCRNRFRCHGQSVPEPAPSRLSNFGHSVTIYDLPCPKSLMASGFFHDPHGLTEVLGGRFFLLWCWMAGLLFELIGLALRFVAFGSFLCHAQSLLPCLIPALPCETPNGTTNQKSWGLQSSTMGPMGIASLFG